MQLKLSPTVKKKLKLTAKMGGSTNQLARVVGLAKSDFEQRLNPKHDTHDPELLSLVMTSRSTGDLALLENLWQLSELGDTQATLFLAKTRNKMNERSDYFEEVTEAPSENAALVEAIDRMAQANTLKPIDINKPYVPEENKVQR